MAQQVSVKKVRKEIFEKELGYKDESNPFGDQKLTEKFTWKKKNEYLQAAGLYRPSSKDQDVSKMESKVREIHQVKKRRDEREVERSLLEAQRQDHDKEMHDEEYGEWLTKEEKFHLDNAKARTQLRIEQGRERPLDLVAKSLGIAGGEEFEEMTILDKPPHQLFVNLTLDEAEEVMDEISTFCRIDKDHLDFWKAMRFICNDAIIAKQSEKAGRSKAGSAISGLGAGVAEGVVGDIHEMLSGQTKRQLGDMLVEIKGSIGKGSKDMDTQFFEAVASKIPLYVARAEVEHWHLRAKVKSDSWLKKKEAEDEAAIVESAAAKAKEWADLPSGMPDDADGGFSPDLEPLDDLEEELPTGACSPVLEPLSKYNLEDLLDPDEDLRVLKQVRQTILEAFGGSAASASGSGDAGVDRSSDEALFRAEMAKGMVSGEVAFNAMGKGSADEFHGEITLDRKHYEWEDKYKPRKPRFFNRVKTGFEWNKYNQTHYDHDTPPPKIVQGYKFNIFYPDLIDKAKAPVYHLEKSDTGETCMLRFSAGPPYEDVAFKIINREWNLSHKWGFRCVFDRGVLQLYFNVKRWRYRR
ncbi:unnamed protein product [Polarella glacialis]|uniref:Splicing factor Cactin n=2 Tax=Polarella glacialis TaxID=89957 RepID=A0A813FMR5_POLGL|nr:unnamed protein product [Polarella glacialis]